MTKEQLKKEIDKAKVTLVTDYDDDRPDLYRVDLSKSKVLSATVDVPASGKAEAKKAAYETLASSPILFPEK